MSKLTDKQFKLIGVAIKSATSSKVKQKYLFNRIVEIVESKKYNKDENTK
jgi:hypothetical protein